MTKVFVVLERGYEYNDEGYDSTDGGNVIAALATREAAEAEARRRTIDLILSSSDFVVDAIYYCDLGNFKTRDGRAIFEDLDREDATLVISTMTQQDAEDFADGLRSTFFMVQPATLT